MPELLSWSASVTPGMRQTELCEGVRALFTARHGGRSAGAYDSLNLGYSVGDDPAAVTANREIVRGAASAGAGPKRLAWMWQVHGSAVAYVSGDAPAQASPPVSPPVNPQVDGIFTDSPAVALVVQVADCAPVLLADPAAGLVGAAHAGRPGMAAGVVPALVAAMTDRGADPGRMRALIGPAICGRCYEVPAQLRDEVSAAVPGSACVTSAGTPGLDLRTGLHGQLASVGIGEVADDARCTAECGDLYSYRRDGKTGRFAGLIWLTP